MEAGEHEYRLQPVAADTLVQSVVDEFSENVREKGYRLELSRSGSVPPIDDEAKANSTRKIKRILILF
jgi:hypothetical protein